MHFWSRIVLCLWPGLLLAVTCFAQSESVQQRYSYAPSNSIRFDHISYSLFSQTEVILQDHEGFIWIGQRGAGLFKYDGYSPRRFVHDPDDVTSLSKNEIRVIFEDSRDQIWVGTQGGGLNRFDRTTETFTRFQHDRQNPISLSNDSVFVITEDGAGTLWVGTSSGLNRFDPETETFARFYPEPSDIGSRKNWIRALLIDREGTLWVGAWGVNRFMPLEQGIDGSGDRFTSYLPYPVAQAYNSEDPDTFFNMVWSIHEDRSGRLWIGTERGGLYQFDPSTPGSGPVFTNYRNNPRDVSGLVTEVMWDHRIPYNVDIIWEIVEDPENGLWLGTQRGGLVWFDQASGRLATFKHDPLDPYGLSNNHITALHVDRQGILWVGSLNGGIDRLDRASRPFEHIYARRGDPDHLSGSFIQSIYEGPDGILWVATLDVLNRIDRSDNTYQHFRRDSTTPNSLLAPYPVLVDRSGMVWLGGGEGVLSRMSPGRLGHFIHLYHDARDPESLPPGRITSFYEDQAERLWIGTRNFGISRLVDPDSGRFIRFAIEDDHGYVNSFFEDESGMLWIGTTRGGLYRFDPETETFRNYRPEPGNIGSVSSAMIFGICGHSTQPDVLWVGAYSGGLSRLDKQTGIFTHYTMQNSDLPDNGVQGVLCDAQESVWVSTDNGIARFEPRTETFKNYDTGDGLQGHSFHSWAYHKSAYTGEMFFGGSEGLNTFFPDQIRDNLNPPEVVLTSIRLFNEPITPGPDSPLERSITETEFVSFTHNQNDLTLEYVGLHFRHPELNQYAYILEPYHADWRMVGAERSVTFTNLDPGDYVFRVKASNSDGIWSEPGTSLRITIQPPWWVTTWAYLLYSLLFIRALFVVDRFQRRRLIRIEREQAHNVLKQTHTELEETHRQLKEAQIQLESLDAAKSRFFANVSHEFRTPLTLIVGPLEDLQHGEYGSLPEDVLEQVNLAVENSRRLLHLVNQLLDIARLESGRMKLNVQLLDAPDFVRSVAQRFTSMAAYKRIDFQMELPEVSIPLYGDAEQLDKVLSNLLGNAFKFTPTGGTITVQMTTETDRLMIAVHNTGSGIAPEHLPHLFERFYQADDTATRRQAGTGIGLALVKELVELHHGTIAVDSNVGRGTTFTVCLCLGSEHVAEIEQLDNQPIRFPTQSSMSSLAALVGEVLMPEEGLVDDDLDVLPPDGEDVTTVLVVDDNTHVRVYLRRHLASRYRVLEAGDGQAALALAVETLPDLIVSDVMMPRMDGFALCHAIKTHTELDFIPVILLTARASTDSKIEGLETGADAYMTKPFNVRELEVRIDNLIESRRQLKARFSQPAAFSIGPALSELTNTDQAFLNRVQTIIMAHLSEEEFGVQALIEELGQSRASLYRRFEKLLGRSPVDLIWQIRLDTAAQMLQAGTGTVGEVAYGVGFKSVSHFSKKFKEQFDISPSVYRTQSGPAK